MVRERDCSSRGLTCRSDARVATGRPVLVDDLGKRAGLWRPRPSMIAGVDEAGMRSMCAVPMMKERS